MTYLSVTSGIEAATVAWTPLGWQALAFSEIDPFPKAVLAHHYPDVPDLGDMTKYRDWSIDGQPNILVGGTPCQSFSVAGLRRGIDDPRGALMLVYLAIARRYHPPWVVWENVPGVLSSNGGRDFGTFLRALGECGYGFAYRVLNAQFFGVPQRRRRVFVVGHLGDWRPAAAVLFESTSLRGDPAPSREAGQGAAAPITRSFEKHGGRRAGNNGGVNNMVTQALTAGLGTGGPDAQHALAGWFVPEIVGQAMSSKWSKGTAGPAGDEHHNLIAYAQNQRNEVRTLEVAGALGSIRRGDAKNETCIRQLMDSRMAVRRLTPRECERLQGFPDDYTAITYRGKPASDGPRYRALGNSMAVPVMAWIGRRISAVEEAMT